MGDKAPAVEIYKPSRIHKLFDWIARLPGPYWLYYVAFAVIAGVMNPIVAWNDRTVPFGEISLYYACTAFFVAYYVFELDFLFRVSREALADFRPILEVPESDFERVAYEFTHLPARSTAAVFALGAIVGLGLGWSIFPTAVEMNQAFPELELPIFTLSSAMGYVGMYTVARAFVLTNRVYRRLRRVSFYDLDSLYALSTYAAW
jgi:hypothetical protein